MTNLNSVILQGRLTKDAADDMKQSANGTAFGTFTLVVDKSVKKGDEWENQSSFIKCKGFGKSYESAVKHMTKGSICVVEGYLEQQSWEKDGQKRSEIVVIVDKFFPTYKKNDEGKSGGQKKVPAPQNDEGFPEDLPF